MKLIAKLVGILLLIAMAFYLGGIARDQQVLTGNLIRLHVVADSDSAEDQRMKLQVRDAITDKLETMMDEFQDLESAKAYLQEQLPVIEGIANDVLRSAGSACKAIVTLAKETFPTREYDTFTLPAGVYESLRVTIGSGEGQNWWCVVFPRLCVSATADGFEDTAAGAGFSEELSGSLTGKPQYRVRFFLMDCIGWVENWIYEKGF